MEPIKCVFLEPTKRSRRWLRRYVRRDYSTGEPSGWTCEDGWHEAKTLVGDVRAYVRKDGYESPGRRPPKTDRRWPKKCAKCGYRFKPTDEYQLFTSRLYRNTETGEITTLRDAPVGAMWDANWFGVKGPDGRCLVVRCPPKGAEWMIDSRASNCTMPADNVHRCWTRSGEPPMIDVSKSYGPTCAAGAGSILIDGWHGFLRNGFLVE